jgi:hypothetical protein
MGFYCVVIRPISIRSKQSNRQQQKQQHMIWAITIFVIWITWKLLTYPVKMDALLKAQRDNGCISYHCWIQDTKTGKIIDDMWEEYEFVKKFNNCVGEPVYQKFPNGRMKKLMKEMKMEDRAKSLLLMSKKNEIPYRFLRLNQHKFNNCANNCVFNYVEHGGKNLKFCIGRMGWKREDGTTHWEYE